MSVVRQFLWMKLWPWIACEVPLGKLLLGSYFLLNFFLLPSLFPLLSYAEAAEDFSEQRVAGELAGDASEFVLRIAKIFSDQFRRAVMLKLSATAGNVV